MKIRFVADADLRQAIVDGVVRRRGEIDFHASPFPQRMKDHEVLLEAANMGCVLVSHDVSTMPFHFHRFREQHESPGVILVPQLLPTREAIDRLISIWEHCEAEDFHNLLRYA